MKNSNRLSVILTLILLMPLVLMANHLVLENVSITDIDTGANTANIKFDINWENSWRNNGDGTMFSSNNWDAAWVFAKYRVDSGDWNHCTLATSGHTAPIGSVIENPSASTDNRRSGDGSGSNDWNDAKIVWDYGADGVANDASVEIRVFAIEMCYVQGGAFYAGDNATSNASLRQGANDNDPWYVNDSDAMVMNGGEFYYVSAGRTGEDATGSSFTIPANFPNGYDAFYCMKYEITQGQWVDFCNTITSSQAARLWYITNIYRHGTLSGSHPNYATSRPDRCLNYLSILDGMAYADWAGLRPMTELEFEKACRGDQNAISGEFAWGTNTICDDNSLTISGTEDGTETVTGTNLSNGACLYGNNTHSGGDGGKGPLRAGIFAKSSTDRLSSGATFYGIMEMSGSMWERAVTLSNSTGRGFAGSHGDGSITSDGYANKEYWPGYSSTKNSEATGSGFRGGDWDNVATKICVSHRYSAAYTNAGRSSHYTFRACRSE